MSRAQPAHELLRGVISNRDVVLLAHKLHLGRTRLLDMNPRKSPLFM